MRIRATAAIATALLCAAISAYAQAPAQVGAPPAGQVEVTVYGAGASSCGKWLADRENLIHSVELNWVLGFLTAAQDFLGEMHLPQRHTDAPAITAWVDKYCRENPLKNIADASANLVIELSKPQ
jgi:hypothetical protein